MKRAFDSSIGLPRSSTSASRMLVFLMPPEVRRSFKSASLRRCVGRSTCCGPRGVETPGSPGTHRSASTQAFIRGQPPAQPPAEWVASDAHAEVKPQDGCGDMPSVATRLELGKVRPSGMTAGSFGGGHRSIPEPWLRETNRSLLDRKGVDSRERLDLARAAHCSLVLESVARRGKCDASRRRGVLPLRGSRTSPYQPWSFGQ